MIIVRRVGSGRLAKFNSQAQYNYNLSKASEQKLLDTLNKAQSQGVDVNDPRVLMSLVSKSGGAKEYPMFYTRKRRTKTGKIVVEQVRR